MEGVNGVEWTPAAVRTLRAALRLSQDGFARLLEVDAKSVRKLGDGPARSPARVPAGPGHGRGVPIVHNDEPVLNVQVAHIRALNPRGPRYDERQSGDERDKFSNLLLLCHPHHKTVDGIGQDKYAVDLLLQWKSQRETPGQAALLGLRNVTEDSLQELIADALESRDSRVQEALAQLHEVNAESAQLLQGLVEELTYLRRSGSIGLDPDTIGVLATAARHLRHINEDTVGALATAASELRSLGPELIDEFATAAKQLGSLDADTVHVLALAAYRLQQLDPDTIDKLA